MKTLDEINDEFKNLAITRNNLIDEFLEDLYGHRGKNEFELVHYLVELENKWEAKKNEGKD